MTAWDGSLVLPESAQPPLRRGPPLLRKVGMIPTTRTGLQVGRKLLGSSLWVNPEFFVKRLRKLCRSDN